MASPFSGKAGRVAGMWAIEQALQDYNLGANKIESAKADTLTALDRGRTGALTSIGQGRTDSLAALGQGMDAARPQYQGAIDRYNPYTTAGTGALTAYQGSLGLGGDAAYDSAVSSFREAPGYRYSVDQATDAVARKASALGALGSGNTMQAISDRAQNMADQGYGAWQGQLKGLADTGLAATGAQAGIQTQLGNLEAQYGRDQSGVYSGAAGQEAGIYTGTAGQEAGAYQGYAGLDLGNIARMSDTKISAGTGALMAGQQAAQNKFNFGMQLGNLGANLVGSFMGGKKAA